MNAIAEQQIIKDLPKMSFEEARAHVSWWNNNKKAGSIEPKNVKDARLILDQLQVNKDGQLERVKEDLVLDTPFNPEDIKLPKPIKDFTLEEIQPEIDRLKALLKKAPIEYQDIIYRLKDSLFSKRYSLRKAAHAAANPFLKVDAPEPVPVQEPTEHTRSDAAIPPEPQTNSTTVLSLQKFTSAIATFRLPEITVEVKNVTDINQAVIDELLKQVAEIARKEMEK